MLCLIFLMQMDVWSSVNICGHGPLEVPQKVLVFVYQGLFFVTTDLDPCIDKTCDYFAVCKAFGPKDARCVCVDTCPSYNEPVCSSNGTTYENECVFQREMCYRKENYTNYHPGSCNGKNAMSKRKSIVFFKDYFKGTPPSCLRFF